MAEIVNLRMARKRRRREESAKAAADNRLKHGRGAAEEALTRASRGIEHERFEGHRRDRPDGQSGD